VVVLPHTPSCPPFTGARAPLHSIAPVLAGEGGGRGQNKTNSEAGSGRSTLLAQGTRK